MPKPTKRFADTPAEIAAMDRGVFLAHNKDEPDYRSADVAVARTDRQGESDKSFFVVVLRRDQVRRRRASRPSAPTPSNPIEAGSGTTFRSSMSTKSVSDLAA